MKVEVDGRFAEHITNIRVVIFAIEAFLSGLVHINRWRGSELFAGTNLIDYAQMRKWNPEAKLLGRP